MKNFGVFSDTIAKQNLIVYFFDEYIEIYDDREASRGVCIFKDFGNFVEMLGSRRKFWSFYKNF